LPEKDAAGTGRIAAGSARLPSPKEIACEGQSDLQLKQ